MGRMKEMAMESGYPTTPGYKTGGTSFEAAVAIRPNIEAVRQRVLESLPGTAEEIAARLRLKKEYVAPRLSELVKSEKAYKSKVRRKNETSGLTAAVYERTER